MSINETQTLGFYENNEFLPNFDIFKSKQSQRELFFKFYNYQVNKEFRFSKAEVKRYKNFSIKEAFLSKISSLLNVNFAPSDKVLNRNFEVDKKMTVTINTFLKENKKINIFSPKIYNLKTNEIKVAFNLILMCFDGAKLHLKLDTNKMFSKFVYEKIQKVNQDKFTSYEDNSIDIISSNDTTTKVFTYWEFLNKKDLDIQKAVNKAIDTVKTSEFNQIYLVYPKHKMFDKHIQIKSDELESCRKVYDIKVIPYSLRSILR